MSIMPSLVFDGADFVQERDGPRLRNQLERIYAFMADRRPHTLTEISEATNAPHASVSAQLRNLRKRRHGGFTINRTYSGAGLYEYVMSGTPA